MMKRRTLGILVAVLAVILLGMGGIKYYIQTSAFMEMAGQKVSTAVSDSLGVQVDVGDIQVTSLHDLEIHDLAIYDKQAELIARADKARVTYRLFSALSAPADMVKEVVVSDVTAVIRQRQDDSWNVQDLMSGTSSNQKFHGKVRVERATITGQLKGRELTLTDAAGSLDCADYPVMKFEVTAKNQGAAIETSGTVSSDRQIVTVKADTLNLPDYLDWIPEGTLPDTVVVKEGQLQNVVLHVFRDGSKLSLSGETDFSDGAANVLGTDITDIHGHTSFTNAEALVFVDAEAAGQKANAHGKIRLDTGTPYLDLTVSSSSFDPSKILKNIPAQGALSFEAAVKGPLTDPEVDGSAKMEQGTIEGIPVQNVAAKVRYQDQHVFVQDVRASVLGGRLAGEAAVSAADMSYTAHIKADGIDLAQAAVYEPSLAVVTGRVSADVGITGKGTDRSSLQVYGNASLSQGDYRGIAINSLTTSFCKAGDSITIDYLSANLPNHTSIGLEGTIENASENPKLDLAFYGGHVDLSLLQQLDSNIDMSGLADFKGTVHGDSSNPQVAVNFLGQHGAIFKQPFDSLKFTASGSLDGIGIDSFLMEKDGKETWRAAGAVGFTGERKINLQLDTMGARMEDIAALLAPDQPITGNVDNIIKVTGTLDNPSATGYIHFYQGSYHGVLLSGMDGDYFLENGLLRLQDFHAYSPMIDMVLNGTINQQLQLDMVVAAKDIDLKRVEHKLPYEVSGHGTFNGRIGGTISAPEFHGTLDAPNLVMNDQVITNVHGMVKYNRGILSIDQFGFQQNEGSYDMVMAVNTDTRALSGNVVVQNADINAITALLNQKNKLVQGRLSSGIELSGTVDNPTATVTGEIASGTIGGYDIHQVGLDLRLMNHIIYINKLSGAQGTNGQFQASGTVALDGPIQARLTATGLAAGMFTKMAGVNTAVTGTADVTADFGGYTNNPSADVTVTAKNGGVQGATFDTLDGVFHLKDGLVNVEKFTVQKLVGTNNCSATAKGVVPLRAVTARSDEWLDDQEQIQLTVDLDQADLSLLPTLSKHVDWALGDTDGKLKVHGTLAHPLIDGNVSIPSGSMKFKELEKPVTDMKAQVVFSGNKVTVKEFSGKMGNGMYSLDGSLELDGLTPNHYDFTLVLDRLDIQSKFFRGPLNARLHLGDSDFYGHHWPKLSGQIDFKDCIVSVPAIPDSDGSLPEIVFDVQVNVGNKVHFYSPYLYDLYLNGQFHVGGVTSHPKMSGSLQVKRGGTINYLKTVFKVREGAAYFNQVGSFMPSIDFQADTRLTQAKVFLSAKGPLGGNMDLQLTSSPEMSQTQIIQMLTLRNAYKNGQTNMNVGDLLAVGLQMSFLSEVEGAMKDFLYLDRFTISRGSGSALDTHMAETDTNKYDFNVEMGKYISDKVMLKYTHGLGGKNINRYGVQYDVNDKLGLTLEREDGDFVVGLEARTTF